MTGYFTDILISINMTYTLDYIIGVYVLEIRKYASDESRVVFFYMIIFVGALCTPDIDSITLRNTLYQ